MVWTMIQYNNLEKVEKLWGYEQTITNNELYCSKIIHIDKDYKGSWHYHKIKDETFFIMNGALKLKYSATDEYDTAIEIVLGVGETFRITPNLRHQIIGIADCDILETSTSDSDSDSYRVISSEEFNGK